VKTLFVYNDVNSSEPARYACGISSLSVYVKKFGRETLLAYVQTVNDCALFKEKIIQFKLI
jgi:hypothetical protein